MTKIPAEIVEKFGLVASNITLKDSFAKDAKIYLMPSLSNNDVKVYLAECDLHGNTDKFGMIDVLIKTKKFIHSKVSLELLYSRIALRAITRIKERSAMVELDAAADNICLSPLNGWSDL